MTILTIVTLVCARLYY